MNPDAADAMRYVARMFLRGYLMVMSVASLIFGQEVASAVFMVGFAITGEIAALPRRSSAPDPEDG